jgi:hypothetical protein
LPSLDLEDQIPATPAIQLSEAKGNTKEGQENISGDRIEARLYVDDQYQ